MYRGPNAWPERENARPNQAEGTSARRVGDVRRFRWAGAACGDNGEGYSEVDESDFDHIGDAKVWKKSGENEAGHVMRKA